MFIAYSLIKFQDHGHRKENPSYTCLSLALHPKQLASEASLYLQFCNFCSFGTQLLITGAYQQFWFYSRIKAHQQTYKETKQTKNSRARALKQRAKRVLVATVKETQETPITELSLKETTNGVLNYTRKEMTTSLINFS